MCFFLFLFLFRFVFLNSFISFLFCFVLFRYSFISYADALSHQRDIHRRQFSQTLLLHSLTRVRYLSIKDTDLLGYFVDESTDCATKLIVPSFSFFSVCPSFLSYSVTPQLRSYFVQLNFKDTSRCVRYVPTKYFSFELKLDISVVTWNETLCTPCT